MKTRICARPAAKKVPALTLEQMIRSISKFNATLDAGQPGVRMILTWGQDPAPPAAQVPAPEKPAAPAAERFTVAEETVLDNVTGLMWTRKNVGTKRLNWDAAKKACDGLALAGCSDWRLPTVQELLTLVDYSKTNPAIDPAFQCESSWYWTSTPYAGSPSDYAWIVYFHDGYSNWGGQDSEHYVRAVRAGQGSGQFGLRLK